MTTKAYNIGYALGSETARGVPVAHQGFQTPPASPYKSYKHFRAWYDGFVYGYRDVMAVRLNLKPLNA